MPSSVRRRVTVAASISGLLAAPLAVVGVTAAPASAAPVELTLLTFNDFHGRIVQDVPDDPATPDEDEDADTLSTVEFASTIESLRTPSTLLLSGGDNVGASLFASSYAEDKPTIDVLNALEVDTSAVGNHEFDRGYDWLQAEPYSTAEWPTLGANVYDTATGEPALPEFSRHTVGGLEVCVVGAVTQETPSLVNPAGIAGLEFRDPVEEVNRVVGELGDTCQVTVAAFHEGAVDGDQTLAENVAEGGAFKRIVEETDPSVDAIVNAHTHQSYAYSASVPGGGTRPVIQAGSYGEGVGQVTLTVDDVTGAVSAHTEAVVPVGATEDLANPTVAAVQGIVDDAVAAADEIGNQKVGRITDDITTAYTGGRYGREGYTGGERDDRGSESTLGHLVADMLRETPIAGQPRPDIGVTNPGGLRAELLYEGDTSTSPENTDGVVTFEEANAVLPFVNNISYVKVSGRTFKRILEQQWQPEDASRPFLHLGLSENVHTTLDPDRPRGDRVTSVRINGKPLRAKATYTIATFSFLAGGGDNFTAFTQGTATDTGRIDRELWIDDFLGEGGAKSPDYRRRQVYTDAPARVTEGRRVSLRMDQLDLTSQGTPANSSVRAVVVQRGRDQRLGSFPVTYGTAFVDLRVPRRVARGATLRLVTNRTGTRVDISVRQRPRADSVLSVKDRPRRILEERTRLRLRVRVRAEGEPAAGRVRVLAGGRRYIERLDEGRARFRLRPFRGDGRRTVRVRYLGTWNTQPDVERFTVRVRDRDRNRR